MSTGQDESALYDDLKGFLLSDRADLRMAATEAVLQVRDFRGMEKMIQESLVEPLAKNCSYNDDTAATEGTTTEGKSVSVNALKALVYLSSHGTSANQCVEDLMQAGGLNRMIEIVLSRPEKTNSAAQDDLWGQRVNYAMSLLANMTRTEAGAVDLVGRTLPDRAILSQEDVPEDKLPTKPTLELLLARFLTVEYTEPVDYEELETDEALDSQSGDPYQHFAAVLMNSTQVEAGREFALKIHRKNKDDVGITILQRVLHQLRSANPIRRRGIAGMIRNCCLDIGSAWWFINVVKIAKYIMYPLAGPEELDVDEKKGLDPDLWLQGPDKVREPDRYTRLFLAETILLLLATGRASREQLRLDRVYVIVKYADMVEEDEDIAERFNESVQYLRRDEEGTHEGSSDKFVEDAYTRKPVTALQIGTSAGADADFDDVD
jgi:hypothetical protein